MYRVYRNMVAAACLSLYFFIFLSNFQTLKFFVTLFSGTMRPKRLKLGTHMDSGQMYLVYRNQAASAYSSLYFFRNCEACNVDTLYIRGQMADVSCVPESGCCFLFVPLFFIFLSLQF